MVLQQSQYGGAAGADRVRVPQPGEPVRGLERDEDRLLFEERLHRVGPDRLDLEVDQVGLGPDDRRTHR
jgi:hypothetical protein